MRFLLCLAAALALFAHQSAQAHPFHVTFAEAEFNAKTKSLEVALRVNPNDLEHALRRMTGKRVVLETTPKIGEIIQKYVSKTFKVRDTGQKHVEYKWVGHEVGIKHAWLYFEFPLPGGLEGSELENQFFFELQTNQVNTINVIDGEKTTTLHLHRNNPRGKIPKQ